MTLQCKRHIGRIHPAAVIRHLDTRSASLRQDDRNVRRLGVDRVLDKFLQRTGGSFDHFTRRDAVDQMFGQAPY